MSASDSPELPPADPSGQKATIRLGTRGSKLAMWQSTWVKTELEKNDVEVELIRIKTEGDTATGPCLLYTSPSPRD